MADPLVIGIGNSLRRDDGVGPWVATRLARAGANARAHDGDGADLIELMRGQGAVVLVDATRSARPPGTLTEIDAAAAPVPADLLACSSHRFGAAQAVEVARRLHLLPPILRVIGIEGADFGPGEGLSAPVLTTAQAVCARLCAGRG